MSLRNKIAYQALSDEWLCELVELWPSLRDIDQKTLLDYAKGSQTKGKEKVPHAKDGSVV